MRKPFAARWRISALAHELRRDGISIVTVSVGAAFTRSQTGAKLEKIIHEADRALYLAKASGRNCARLFDPNDPQSSDESENIAALLKIAIGQKLVSMVYQPIQDVASGRVEAVEALMRLKMLDGTSVPPSLFIPVAERTGAILELGRWAIRTVCAELLADNHVQVVSVNVSPIQLKTPGFATSVARHPRRDRRAGQPAGLRDHRRSRDGDALRHPSLHQRPEAARDQDMARRFRHRLRRPVVASADRFRHGEDRSLVPA